MKDDVWSTYDWPEGQLLTKGARGLIAVDANGAQVAEFRVGDSNLRVCTTWHDKTGKPLHWRDAVDIYAKFPKWLRAALTERLSGTVAR